jgi:hypothetical protein
MSDRFEALLAWWDRDASVEFEVVEAEVRRILSQHDIRMRQDDGDLAQLNFSLPQSCESGLVLGLRYRKRDGTLTEDHFLCTQPSEGLEIVPYYRGSLERALPEYRGTHKQDVDLVSGASSPCPDGFVTNVNTITFTKGFK